MNGTNLFKIALRALANNKLRAFLTMLGIIIGVASVITMLAIGQGSKKSIQAQISEMGSNMIMIHPGADMRGGVRQDPSAMQTLKLADYEALRNETNFLSAVSPNVSSSGQLIAGNNNYPSSVSGVGTPAYGGQRSNVYRSRYTDFSQSMRHRKDDTRESFSNGRRPRRTHYPVQPSALPRGGCTKGQRI